MLTQRTHKVAVYIAFVLLIAWVLWSSSQRLYSPINHINAQTEHSASNKQSIEERHQATEEAVAYYNKWLMFFTAALAVATIALGFATVGLYLAGERQFKLARDEFLSTHRPKIRIKHVWLASEFMHDRPIIGRITYVNGGTSDATIVQYGMSFLVIKAEKPLPFPTNFPENFTNTTLPPGVSLPFPDVTYTLAPEDEVAVRNGGSKFFFAGYLIYRDGMQRFRTTAFCRVMSQPRTPLDTGRLTVYDDPNYEYQD